MRDVTALDIPLAKVATLMYESYIKGKFSGQFRKPVDFDKLGPSEQAGWIMAARCGCDIIASKIQEHLDKIRGDQSEISNSIQ